MDGFSGSKRLKYLKKYVACGAFLGLIFFFLILYEASSEEPLDTTLNDIGAGIVLSLIYGALFGVMIAVIRIISISIEDPPGMKISVPIIFVCTLSFLMIGIIFSGIIGYDLGIRELGFIGGIGGTAAGRIVGMYISALYRHADVRKTIEYATDEVLKRLPP